MITNRLIATLLVYNGVVVQTKKFNPTNFEGNAFTAVDFFNSWAVDEICILEISNDLSYLDNFVDIIEELSKRCFVPLTVGGKIRSVDDAHKYLRAGADKVIVNSGAFENKDLIKQLSDKYGSQCITLSVDAIEDKKKDSGYKVMINNGKKDTDLDLLKWINDGIKKGSGEIFLNSINYDGNKKGYDLKLIELVSKKTNVPVIAMGGVGEWQHLVDGIKKGKAQSVAAGNIFHYSEHSTRKAKEYMISSGIQMRPIYFYHLNSPRKIKYRTNTFSNND